MKINCLAEYRLMKGIRRPSRFCYKGELWCGNAYVTYGAQQRNGNRFTNPTDWEMF